MDESKFQLEKPWAVYGVGLGATGIGVMAEKPSNSSGYIIYSEGQVYPSELWNMHYVHTFAKLNEAVDYFLKNQCPIWEDPYSKEDITRHLHIHFPQAMKQEKQKELHSLVDVLKKVTISQSLAKCTQQQPVSCIGCVRREKTC